MAAHVTLPNVRKMFVPDPGYVIFDSDLAGADAQVVAWEAKDEDLKSAFRAGLDVHDKNAQDMWGQDYICLAGTADSGPKSKKRKECKQGVHACNYGVTPNGMHHHPGIGWPIPRCIEFQNRWFSLHPKCKERIQNVQKQLDTNRTITNGFGYRRVFFDRPDACLPEALAWSPQSTVALVTYRGAIQLENNFHNTPEIAEQRKARNQFPNPYLQILLQNHDSLVFQVQERYCDAADIALMKQYLRVPIPYPDDPLTIQWGVSISRKSWGDCEKVKDVA